MKVDPLNLLWRILDLLMIPLMYLISGTLRERPQESHVWHGQNLNPDLIDSINPQYTVTVQGDEPPHRLHGGIAFHVPILGGWKNYVVLEVQDEFKKWHIGWIIRQRKDDTIVRFQLHKLPIFDSRIRLLSGTNAYTITFFSVDESGRQLPLREVGKGHIGDLKNPHIRLF